MKQPPIPLEEAQARLLALASPLPIEHVDVQGALGRYLAEPLHARRTQPVADLSAMDGYAVGADDMAGPWKIIGESAAGHPFGGKVAAGQAVRIATGALLPDGAAAVILQEDIARDGASIALAGEAPIPLGKHVRRRGLDFVAGDVVLPAGTRLGPTQAALALAAGHAFVPVRCPPRVAVIDSGDELTTDVSDCAPHQIPASNGIMLSAMAAALSCSVQRIGPVPDDKDALASALARAEEADVIVTSGGASVGDHDLLRPALVSWGAEIEFWRVAIKPGKPIQVATRGRQVIIGLPGNPVSSHVTAYLFLLPLLRALQGAAAPLPRRIRARLGAPLRGIGDRREFVRGVWDGEAIVPQEVQDSGAMRPLAASNSLIDREAGSPPAEPGDMVYAFLLENGGST